MTRADTPTALGIRIAGRAHERRLSRTHRKVSIVVGGPYNSGILAHDGRNGARRKGPLLYEYQPAPPDIVARVSTFEAVCAFWAELRAKGLVRPHAPVTA